MSSFHRFELSHCFLKFLLTLFICILFGFGWFLLLYGPSPLYSSNVNWIYNAGKDVFQHQIGWEWFRQEPWHFPIGRIDAYGYPVGTFISYTDSIPIFAIFFKLLSPWLSQNFQYLGLWELVSLICQLLMGMLILDEFTHSYVKKILGASLLVLSPVLIFRVFYHDSLTAQWILLAGFWFILLEYRHKLWRGSWIVLFTVAMLVHLYFVAMLLPLWAISLYFRNTREKNKWMLIVDVFAVFGTLLLVGYSTGLFSVGVSNLEQDGFGFFSWNLNGFINPGLNSSILHQLPSGTTGQYEGFSYLGLGNLLLLPIALIMFLKKDNARHKLFFFLPFVVVSILFILFALSNKAYLGNHLLWNIERPELIINYFSLFRSSGRFIWPVFYVLVLFGIICIVRNSRFATVILLLAVVLQFLDLQPLLSSKNFTNVESYQSPMQADFWQAAAKVNQHIVLIPALNAWSVYEPISLYARQNKMTLNWGYFARANYGPIENYAHQVWGDLLVNKSDNQTMYIFWSSEWEELAKDNLPSKMLMCQVDGYEVVLSKDNRLVKTNFNLSHYCTFP